jgi:hypothetical protein
LNHVELIEIGKQRRGRFIHGTPWLNPEIDFFPDVPEEFLPTIP